jgi:hypothetical protein
MSSKFFRVRIKAPTLMSAILIHNGNLADPLYKYSKLLKSVTSKRQKSDADHERVAELEFQGSLYFDETVGPFIPGDMLDATIQNGGKKKKLGKSIATSVRVLDDVNPLVYKGPRTREGLWKDPEFRDRRPVKVTTSKVIRTRPKFTGWSVEFCVELFSGGEVNPDDLKQAIIDAGTYAGLGDYRPRFGLFHLESFEEIGNPTLAAAAE